MTSLYVIRNDSGQYVQQDKSLTYNREKAFEFQLKGPAQQVCDRINVNLRWDEPKFRVCHITGC